MAVVNNHKSFEQSLRSASAFAPLLRPIKSEIHKGCTGKAHGCGTRKNSRSTYSSISDSSSEVSPAPSVERDYGKRAARKEPDNTSCESLPRRVQRNDSIKSNKSHRKASTETKPPWHNVYTAKLSGLKVDSGRIETPDRRPPKTTRKPPIQWQDLYEKAINQKLYGGLLMRYSYYPNEAKSSAADQVNAIANRCRSD